MQKNKALSILALISISLTVLFTIPIHAEITVDITPDSGAVGTEVLLEGSIETLGGAYSIWFDADRCHMVFFRQGNSLHKGFIIHGGVKQ